MALVERCVDYGFGEIKMDYRTRLVAERAGGLSVASAEDDPEKDYFDESFHGVPSPAALEGRTKHMDVVGPGHVDQLTSRL